MKTKILKFLWHKLRRYHPKKYWKMRDYIVRNKGSIIKKVWYLYRIKKMDAFNNASFGTHLDKSATFLSMPSLPHGLSGIYISHNAVIGKNAKIFHQVTIGEGKDGAPIIGDNCVIGAGAKIIGAIHIGDNVRIGANCVVVEDIPSNCTVVMHKPRVIQRQETHS